MNYCKEMQYDILGLPELHNVQNKKAWRRKFWITSEDAGIDKQGKCVDSSAGVGILLSKHFCDKNFSARFDWCANCMGSA